ncbi:SusC/RagA family TonB-linked outer membrane protein [Arcticibacter tournemirensis]|uniref:TonB-dependent receptor n=1 Tax=Arcticibacter tournemirensis TaxID=699437 RepID=A0A4Q0MF41_9SPHI|nr:TonB-dependent receptor [Arcticibacter tournemirensis]RXF71559.1 TonB-dependent receptor [Arcticibacter tournemirensis]
MKRTITKRRIRVLLWAIISMMLYSVAGYAQNRTITGKVTAVSDKQPVPGVAVKIKGKTGGTSTDVGGAFTIKVSAGDVLQFSSVGFQAQEVAVGQSNTINVQLKDDVKDLDEVVVVGYGVQRKKLVTGATVQVKGEDLQRQNTTNALMALQGQTPGVQITSTSGQPGEGMKVVVRGLGTINNAGPLYIVDGVQTGDISYLNPADIESIDILKDAASAAIYGSQAANGVVLVTTRQGKAGQAAQINFDSFTGIQNVASKAELLNSQQYASIMNEAAVNSGKSPYFTNEQIAAMGQGTNWIDEMFVKDALTQNYSLGAQGSSGASIFSTALSYTSQEGIVGGKALSDYQRYNFKGNSEHNFYKDIVKMGQHLTFSYVKNNGIQVGNQYNNALRGAFNTSPFVPMYDENGNFFDNTGSEWFEGEANPYAQMVYSNQNRRNSQRLVGDVYLIIEPIKGLTFKSSLGMDYSVYETRSFSPIYKLSLYAYNNSTSVTQSMDKTRSFLWENLLTYKFNLNADHHLEVMGGTSSFDYSGSNLRGTNTNLVFSDLPHAWLTNATNSEGANISLAGAPVNPDRRLSYFGRFNYNYRDTYLLNATFRADGSSRFAAANRWGYFPSISAGWVLSNESFLKGQQNWLNYLKFRASWGQVGNQNIDPFQYLTPITFAYTNYIFGDKETNLTPGAYPIRLGNPDIKWETSEQTNLGLDASLLNGKLNVNFDWYDKTTKDWLIEAPVLATAGAKAPFINGGNVSNKGVELAIAYRSNLGDFNYSVGLNGSYNKNKVVDIPNADGIIHGEGNLLFNNSLEFYRAQSGFPIGYFWGLRTNGIFQSEQEVSDHRSSSNTVIQPTAQPGDVRYVDLNNDGVISDLDRTMIGNPNPDYTFGISLSGSYKAFDFSVLASGVAGNELVQSWRNQASQYANYSTAILERWHGPGSSNIMPRVTEDARNWTNFSDLYIHKGDFLRINNITLGYDFGKVLKKSYLRQVRVYASALNVYTFTKYNGMDPEIGYGTVSFASGIDLGYYPRPRTFLLGANIRF